MLTQIPHKKFWVLFFLLLALFFQLKYAWPELVKNIYITGDIDLLNAITGDKEIRSIDYYVGKVDDIFIGPITSLISGLLFLSVCFKFLKKSSAFYFASAVFIYFLVTRLEVLFFPPYGDAIIGPFNDALWIARNDFNFIGLFQQKALGSGGPRNYPISLYPSFLAFVMFVTPTVKVFLATLHLIIFAVASGLITFFRKILQDVFGEERAILGATLLLSFPLFQSMVESTNMEMTCTFFAVASIFYLMKKKFSNAGIMAVMSLLTKAPGGIICATVTSASVLLALLSPKRKNRLTTLAWGAGVGLFTVGLFLFRTRLYGENAALYSTNVTGFMIGASNVTKLSVLWVFFACFLVFIGQSAKKWKERKKDKPFFPSFFERNYGALVAATVVTFWFLLYCNFNVMLSRYKLLLAPFFLIFLLFVFVPLIKNHKMVKRILISLISLSFLFSHGSFDRFFERNPKNYYCEYERSLEYRNDLKLQMRLARMMENKYAGFTIGAPWVTAQALTSPEIGYVTKTLDVIIYGTEILFGNIREFKGLKNIDQDKTIWISDVDYGIPEYPIGPRDEVVQVLEMGDRNVSLFKGGYGVEKRWTIVNLIRSGQLKKFLLLQALKQRKMRGAVK